MTVEKPKLTGKVSAGAKKIVTLYNPRTWREKGIMWVSGLLIATYLVAVTFLMFWWDFEPEQFDVVANAQEMATEHGESVVVGYTTTATLITVAETLLNKSGGYLSNDIFPPGVFMDNVPNWEFGVLVQVRDLARSLRNDLARSQSQSVEDVDLAQAEPQFSFQNDRWILPSTEGEYKNGIENLYRYLHRLASPDDRSSQFFARADNLRDWLAVVEKRLGSLSQRLSASVGQVRINTDLAGDSAATQSTVTADEVEVRTPWIEIDDIFWEARGNTWALIHFMEAIEHDFREVLKKKAALTSLRQIIRELHATQSTVWSPMVLNGGGFSIVTNYSLVMANYVSRANAAVIDLRNLLEQG